MRTKRLFNTNSLSVRLDKKQLYRNVFVDGERIVKAMIIPLVQAKIDAEQERMVDEFEDHPVSQEIWAGNTAENSTGLLGGYGNLFSFIGFDESSDPISPIAQILRRRINFVVKRTNDYGGFTVTIDIPSKEQIDSTSEVEWLKGRSWIDGIEKGLAGLNRYLYDEDYGFENSLSGTGVQSKNHIRTGVTYKRTTYVTKIIRDFKNRLTRLI